MLRPIQFLHIFTCVQSLSCEPWNVCLTCVVVRARKYFNSVLTFALPLPFPFPSYCLCIVIRMRVNICWTKGE